MEDIFPKPWSQFLAFKLLPCSSPGQWCPEEEACENDQSPLPVFETRDLPGLEKRQGGAVAAAPLTSQSTRGGEEPLNSFSSSG